MTNSRGFQTLFNPTVLVRVSTYYFHHLHFLRWSALSGQSCGKILLPLRFVSDSVGQEYCGLSRRALITEVDEIGDASVVRGEEVAGIDGYDCIGLSERATLILQDRHIERVGEAPAQGFQLLASAERNAEIDRDDGIGLHFAHRLDRNVLDHSSIGQ